MALLLAVVDVKVNEKDIDGFIVASKANATNSVQEAGIARFDLIQEKEDPAHFTLFEMYRTASAPASHKETVHYAAWRDSVAPMMAQPRSATFWHTVYPPSSKDQWAVPKALAAGRDTPPAREVLILRVELFIKSEHVDEFRDYAVQQSNRSAAEHGGGNVRFFILQGRDDPTKFLFIEAWRSEDALTFHNSVNLNWFVETTQPMWSSPPSLVKFRGLWPTVFGWEPQPAPYLFAPTQKFEFDTPTRIIFGAGTVAQLGPVAKQYGTRALLVTGRDVSRASAGIKALEAAGVTVSTATVAAEPTTGDTRRAIKVCTENACEVVVSFGGGSAIDCAKAVAALVTNGGDPLDYAEVIGLGKPIVKPPLPFIAVPTTSGTGAEVTRNSVLDTTEDGHQLKVSLRSVLMCPKVAIVDPLLTVSVPSAVTAATGLDAFTQCLEPYVSNKANPVTDGFCREGLHRAARSLRRAYENGSDVEAREDMAVCSLMGGLALANAKLGAVHGFAGVLGALLHAPHGAICAALLPHVIDVNVAALSDRDSSSFALERFDDIGRILTGSPSATAKDAVKWIRELCNALQVPKLGTYGLAADQFADVVAKSQRASSMQGNPIVLTATELTDIITRAT